MKQVAMVLLFDRNNRLLIYLRDDKPDIPFPDHWDFFGGHLEEGETPEGALVREAKEELGVELTDWKFFRTYVCTDGDAYPNIKHIYWAKLDQGPEELTLYEGQALRSIGIEERERIKFANILAGESWKILSRRDCGRELWITLLSICQRIIEERNSLC